MLNRWPRCPAHMRKSLKFGLDEIVNSRNTLIGVLIAYFPEHKEEIENAKISVAHPTKPAVVAHSVSPVLAAKIRDQFPQSIR